VASAERPRGAASALRRLARSSRVRDLAILVAIVVGLGSLWAVADHRTSDGGATAPPGSSGAGGDPVTATPTPGEVRVRTPARVVTPVKELKRRLAKCQDLTVPSDLVVVTYNIKSGHYGGGSRLAGIIAELTAMTPDIVFLQEVRGETQLRAISTALGMAEVYGVNLRLGRGTASAYGTAILSRFPVEDPVNIQLPNRPGLEQRGLLRASVLVEGTPLTVYGTHLQHDSPEMRASQMRTILEMVRDDPAAKILGGDLNDSPRSSVLGSAYTELQDTWSVVGDGTGATVPAARPRNRIDYLLFDQADDEATTLTPLTAQVMGVGSSDHRAVRATFRLTRRIEPACRS
jgi:endonuclease/exonuclease/phosphatase family metal-dependent hydrolase